MDTKVFVHTYKETVKDGNGTVTVTSGVFDYGFDTEEDAKQSLVDIAQKKVEELDCEVGNDVEIAENWNDAKDYVCISTGEDTYEYSIYMVTVPRD